MFSNAKEIMIETDGVRMNCVVFGTGKKTLVLISGLNLRDVRGKDAVFGLWTMYRGYTKEYTVYCFDRREDLPEGFTVRQMAGDIALGMRYLGLSAAYVIGISQGGMIGQYLAIDHPELVRKLVLGVTVSRTNETLRTRIDCWSDMAAEGNMTGIIRDYMETTYSEKYLRKYRLIMPAAVKMTKMMDPKRFLVCAGACLTCETYDLLDQIRCKVLVLGGREDRVATAKASEEIAEKLHCPLYLYDGYGHSVYEEMADDFNARIMRFFAED